MPSIQLHKMKNRTRKNIDFIEDYKIDTKKRKKANTIRYSV